jgi:hemoglobin
MATTEPQITEDQLTQVVAAFYGHVRRDPELGPIFNGAVEDWDEHLQTLARFWSSVMLTTGRYKGNPLAAHMKHVTAISPALFERWLALWRQTTDELVAPSVARLLQAKAERIAESLQLGLFFRLGPADKPGKPQPA